MFRRTRKLIGLGARVTMGAVVGAVLAPVARVLRDRGELHVELYPTCSGMVFEVFVGQPCEHGGDDGGGPEAFDPDFEEGTRHWSHLPPQAGTDDQTVWH